ncbi:MAG: hypothetical protein KatS3mg131_3902 [Candidatus Tectimicrobiota bacterium]|nr:MAG: hypothetical protein KatS3mg131_3902 [Candidatus Tectomicrobia bacterium]
MLVLFTDFGTRDAYVAQMKGVIASLNPRVPILDLTHEAGQFAIAQAAYLLAKCVAYFPAGTVCVAVVDPGVGTARRAAVVVTAAGKFYVGPDNGLFTYVLAREGLQAAYELTNPQYFRSPQVAPTFHGRDLFAPVAAYLTLGVPPQAMGPPLAELVRLPLPQPRLAGDTAYGEVVHIDHFGNVITNIPPAFVAPLAYGALLEVTLAGRTWQVPYLRTYGEGQAGQLLCLRNSDDEVEVALPQGSAAQRCQAQVGMAVRLRRLEPA